MRKSVEKSTDFFIFMWLFSRFKPLCRSLNGLGPIRFWEANDWINYVKKTCNILYCFAFFSCSSEPFVLSKLLRTSRWSNFRWIFVWRGAEKCGLFKPSHAKRHGNWSPRGLWVRAHLGYSCTATFVSKRLLHLTETVPLTYKLKLYYFTTVTMIKQIAISTLTTPVA